MQTKRKREKLLRAREAVETQLKKAETSGASVPQKPLSQRVTMFFSKFKDRPNGGFQVIGDMAKLFGSPDADYAAFLANQLLCAIPGGCDHAAGALNFATTALESIAPPRRLGATAGGANDRRPRSCNVIPSIRRKQESE